METYSVYGEKGNFITHLRRERECTKDEMDLLSDFWFVDSLRDVKRAYISIIAPGGFIMPHIDAGDKFHVRWQIPLQVAGLLWAGGEVFRCEDPYKIGHWLPHAVWNVDNEARIHLIVDLKEIAYTPEKHIPFEFVEAPVNIQSTIEMLKP